MKALFDEDVPAAQVLEHTMVRERLVKVIVLGVDEDGERYFATNTKDMELINELGNGLHTALTIQQGNSR